MHASIILSTITDKTVPTGDSPATNNPKFLAFRDYSHLSVAFSCGEKKRKGGGFSIQILPFSDELAKWSPFGNTRKRTGRRAVLAVS